jgi:hypothetical protein
MKGQQILLNSAHFGFNIGFASKKDRFADDLF